MAVRCTTCQEEFDSDDALAVHNSAQHSSQAARDRQRGWSGTAGWSAAAGPTAEGGAAEPGWQPDPWNAANMRWWDGSDWTGRVTPVSLTPPNPQAETVAEPEPEYAARSVDAAQSTWDTWSPAGSPTVPGEESAEQVAPAPAEEPRSGPQRKKDQPTFAKPRLFGLGEGPMLPLAIATGVALVIVVVVVFLSSGGSPPKNTSAPVIPQPVGGATVQQGLAAGLLQTQDLGAGWTPHPAGHPMAVADYQHGPCGSPLWAHEAAGYQASFINGAATSQSHGAVVNEVLQAPDVSVAAQQQQYTASPAFEACLEQTDGQEALSQLPGATLGQVSATPYALALPPGASVSVQSTAYVVTIPVTAKGGTAQSITDDSVILFSGAYEATLDVSWSSLAPLTQHIVQLQADALAIHLESLPSS